MQPNVRGRDIGGLVFINQLLGIVLLREAIEGHLDRGGLQLGRKLCAKRLEQRDRFRVGHQLCWLDRVEIRAPICRAAQIGFHTGRGRVCRVHLGRQAAVLVQRDLGRPALGSCGRVSGGSREGRHACIGQRGREDIRRGVQIVLRMTADQFQILGKGHIAFQDACAHARGGDIGFHRMLGKLHRRTTVPDREQRLAACLTFTGQQFLFQRSVFHAVNQVIGPWAEFDVLREAGCGDQTGGDESRCTKHDIPFVKVMRSGTRCRMTGA